ncbi:MAG: hypothetical protein ABI658_22940 [Acidimicrobiales bacterium]
MFGFVEVRTGSRAAVRMTGPCVVLNAVPTLPALVVDVDAWIKLVSSIYVLASVLCNEIPEDPLRRRSRGAVVRRRPWPRVGRSGA